MPLADELHLSCVPRWCPYANTHDSKVAMGKVTGWADELYLVRDQLPHRAHVQLRRQLIELETISDHESVRFVCLSGRGNVTRLCFTKREGSGRPAPSVAATGCCSFRPARRTSTTYIVSNTAECMHDR